MGLRDLWRVTTQKVGTLVLLLLESDGDGRYVDKVEYRVGSQRDGDDVWLLIGGHPVALRRLAGEIAALADASEGTVIRLHRAGPGGEVPCAGVMFANVSPSRDSEDRRRDPRGMGGPYRSGDGS